MTSVLPEIKKAQSQLIYLVKDILYHFGYRITHRNGTTKYVLYDMHIGKALCSHKIELVEEVEKAYKDIPSIGTSVETNLGIAFLIDEDKSLKRCSYKNKRRKNFIGYITTTKHTDSELYTRYKTEIMRTLGKNELR